ncbi:kinase-like domain-containing protein [Xylaria flabelliformis]|nr:kinase-like domain-containing protein [Xylaria flabelliformis]
MATHTPIELPYFAPAPVPLPTYEEIITQESSKAAGPQKRKIIKIREIFIVKYGKEVDLAEGENMLIVLQHTSLPIPKLYAMYHHEPSGNKVIIMEHVVGEVLSKCYDNLDAGETASIGAQLRWQLNELRKIPSPGFYGLPGVRPYLPHEWIFKYRAGPFNHASDFLEAYFNAQFSAAGKLARPVLEDMKSQILELSKYHNAPVFTHGDLQPQNIILRKDGSISIIDWESASYCPEYFEFFVHRTYELVCAGLPKGDKDPFLAYGAIVKLIIKVWDTYVRSILSRNRTAAL